MHDKFLPQSVPSYAATEYFNNLRRSFPEYAYKEATAKEMIGERDGAAGKTLYLARPLRIEDPACLVCHSAVASAPPTLIDRYGNANGFGWQLKDVIGAQIVSVPDELPLKRADAALKGFVYLLTGVSLFLFATVNILVILLVVRPVRNLAAIADQVSLGALDAPPFPTPGPTAGSTLGSTLANDEITALGLSFNRMRRSLVEALNMLQ
jgi:protein-histidine pros-kinase